MFSFVFPMDTNRLEQFTNTKRAYDGMPQKKEFVILTRSEPQVKKYLDEHDLSKDVRLIPYTVEVGFNCSKALNLGVHNAQYPYIIITSPEVKPITPALEQLEKVLGTNVLCQVFDEDEGHNIVKSLVNSRFRSESPRMYFLAMFNKSDIERINGWDEDFMKGYGYEDNDFGARWARAKIPFVMRDDIQGIHQYHPRRETIPGGLAINKQKLKDNNAAGIIKCTIGLIKL
jgi:hypothetical protein